VLEDVSPVGAGYESVASPHLVHPLFELLGLLQWRQKKPTEGDQLTLLLLKVPDHLQQITHTLYPKYTLSVTDNYFIFLVTVAAGDCQNQITKNSVVINPLHLDKREVCFGDYQKLVGNRDWIGNLLEHLCSPKY